VYSSRPARGVVFVLLSFVFFGRVGWGPHTHLYVWLYATRGVARIPSRQL
jgi:hypothetical protein